MNEVEVSRRTSAKFDTANQLQQRTRKLYTVSIEKPIPYHEGLPLYLRGEIVKGFGRGSRELGIPTANFSDLVVQAIPDHLVKGVYFGWATLDGEGPIYKIVVSIGWNPFYHNVKKAAETHILHDFGCDLYGRELRILCLGWIRNECSFPNLEKLIEAIQNDISLAKNALELPCFSHYQADDFLK
eukprot:Ihof_evm12s44 gene=Ihof_evmTU12s44